MRRSLIILTILLLACVAASVARAERLGLSNLVVDNHAGRAKVRFGVLIRDAAPILEALENGQVLALECKARLYLKRDYMWNHLAKEAELLSPLVLHDKGPFEISMPGAAREHYRSRELELVMKEAWGSISMDLGPWADLERGRSYSLELEIRLLRQDLPGWLKGTLFFWNFDAIAPATYRLDFSY